jgi:hypothetical protein
MHQSKTKEKFHLVCEVVMVKCASHDSELNGSRHFPDLTALNFIPECCFG